MSRVLREVRVCNCPLKMGQNDRQMETFWKHLLYCRDLGEAQEGYNLLKLQENKWRARQDSNL